MERQTQKWNDRMTGSDIKATGIRLFFFIMQKDLFFITSNSSLGGG